MRDFSPVLKCRATFQRFQQMPEGKVKIVKLRTRAVMQREIKLRRETFDLARVTTNNIYGGFAKRDILPVY